MPSELELTFPRRVDRELVKHGRYHLVDWQAGHLLTCTTVELTLGLDGYQQLADDAAVGRDVTRWRARNPQLAALLDAEATLDALAADRS